jgi:hypothetical protein
LFALAVTRFGAANRRGSAALLVGLVLWCRWSAGFGVARFRRGHLGEKWLRAMDSASPIRREPDVIEHDVHHVKRAVRRLRRLNGAQSGTESGCRRLIMPLNSSLTATSWRAALPTRSPGHDERLTQPGTRYHTSRVIGQRHHSTVTCSALRAPAEPASRVGRASDPANP